MKDETGGFAIGKFVGLKSKMCSFLVGNSEHKKNIVATRSHKEYKDVLFSDKYIRQSMNRFQSTDKRIGHMKSTKFHCLVLMAK